LAKWLTIKETATLGKGGFLGKGYALPLARVESPDDQADRTFPFSMTGEGIDDQGDQYSWEKGGFADKRYALPLARAGVFTDSDLSRKKLDIRR